MLGKLLVVQSAMAGMRSEDAYPPVELVALANIVDDVCGDLGDLAYGEEDVSE